MSEIFLYLTTIGRKTGLPRQIEIWFVEHAGAYYLVSEMREKAQWVQNLRTNPQVQFSLGTSEAQGLQRPLSPATARPLNALEDAELIEQVSRLMNAKYNWSDGLIVEIRPQD